MSCNCNNVNSTESNTGSCNCPVKDLSTDCILYKGPDLQCSGITEDTVLTNLITDIDEFICNKFEEAINYLTLINVGEGAEVFRGISNIGQKEIRTLISENTNLLDIVENQGTIGIRPGDHSLSLNSNTDILSLIVTSLSGSTVLTDIDLSEYNYDTFVQNVTFNSSNNVLTIVRNNSEPNIDVDLTHLDNHLESANYIGNSNTVEFNLTDGSTVNLNLNTLLSEIAAAQVQPNYLEDNPSSKAHILNRNPVKTVTSNYTITDLDNNFIIEVDNGANDITINLSGPTSTNNFFVGFVQKGTGQVQFTGYDIRPDGLGDILFGQGHVAGVEIINSTTYLHGTLRAV